MSIPPELFKGRGGQAHPPAEADESSVRWLISYSDFMMQLVCLFILLYSVSNMEQGKMSAMVSHYRAHIGLGESPTVPKAPPEGKPAVSDRSLLGGQLAMGEVPPGLRFQVREVGEGLRVEFDEPIFEVGSFTLSPRAQAVLDDVARTLRSYVGVVSVTGYAASDPADTIEGDAMKLAQTRAEEVAARFTREGFRYALDPRSILSGGSGAAEAAQERRVGIILRIR